MTLVDLYEQTIKPLSAGERLRLAKMIIDGIPNEAVVDYSSEWSEGDLRDFAQAGWKQAGASR